MKHEGGNWCTTLSRAHYLLCVFMDKLTLADALVGIWPQSSPSLTQTGLFSRSPVPSLSLALSHFRALVSSVSVVSSFVSSRARQCWLSVASA